MTQPVQPGSRGAIAQQNRMDFLSRDGERAFGHPCPARATTARTTTPAPPADSRSVVVVLLFSTDSPYQNQRQRTSKPDSKAESPAAVIVSHSLPRPCVPSRKSPPRQTEGRPSGAPWSPRFPPLRAAAHQDAGIPGAPSSRRGAGVPMLAGASRSTPPHVCARPARLSLLRPGRSLF